MSGCPVEASTTALWRRTYKSGQVEATTDAIPALAFEHDPESEHAAWAEDEDGRALGSELLPLQAAKANGPPTLAASSVNGRRIRVLHDSFTHPLVHKVELLYVGLRMRGDQLLPRRADLWFQHSDGPRHEPVRKGPARKSLDVGTLEEAQPIHNLAVNEEDCFLADFVGEVHQCACLLVGAPVLVVETVVPPDGVLRFLAQILLLAEVPHEPKPLLRHRVHAPLLSSERGDGADDITEDCRTKDHDNYSVEPLEVVLWRDVARTLR